MKPKAIWSSLASLVLLGLLIGILVALLKGAVENSLRSAGASRPGGPAVFTPTPTLAEISVPAPTPAFSITATVPLTEPVLTLTPVFTPTDTPSPTPPLTGTPPLEPTIAASPSPTATLDITKDWKIYENREHGFRVKYPPQFTYYIIGPPSPEIWHDVIFYDGAKYQPGVTREEFPLIGLHVLANPQRFSSVEAWAEAHLFSSPGSNQYSLNFESYEIVRTLNIAGVQATRLTAVSAYGHKVHNILIPLPDGTRIIMFYYFTDPSTIEPLFELMASTLELIR